MISMKTLYILILVVIRYFLVECRSYNTGLIFYNLENQIAFLPPTISVSRGRGLAKFKYSSRGSIWSTFGKPCNCNGPSCGCCVGIKVKQYNFDQKMCANVSYARPRDEIELEVFLNDTATAKYGISARNPSPLCVPIMMGIPMSMCIQMSNIGIQGDNLNMCMDFLVLLASTELFEMHFQCMKMGLQGIGWVGADGQPVIPANEGKLKDKIATDSDDYYDESEAENEILSNEKEDTEEVGMKDDDLNKAQEEMDNNDITEKIMGIIKEKEQETLKDSGEASQENAVEEVFSSLQENKNVEEIVTNIMESINQGNTMEETEEIKDLPNEMAVDKSVTESVQETPMESNKEGSVVDLLNDQSIKTETEQESNAEIFKESTKMQTDILDSVKHEVNDINEKEENAEVEMGDANLGDSLSNNLKDELNLEDLLKNSQEKEIESNQEKTQDTIEASADEEESENVMTPIVVMEETTTKKTNDQDGNAIANTELFLSTTDALDINKNHNELHNAFDIGQPVTETSTEIMMNRNLSQTMSQKVTVTSETNNINSMDNHLTTAALMATTTISTTTSKPTKINANFIVAAAFNKIFDNKNSNNNEDHNGNKEEVNEDSDSHENDSDYEESEEAENQTKEKDDVSIGATSFIKSNAVALNSNGSKESTTLQEDDNNSNSKESQSIEDDTENTDDEFETEEGEEYDDEYEDYETTTVEEETSTNNILKKSHNNTCCRPTTPAFNTNQTIKEYNKKAEISQTDNIVSHNLTFVSKNNNTISQTDDKNMLNITSTKKMSQATIDSTATVSSSVATASSTNAAISNVMPLPLALAHKSQSLHHQQQPQQQLKRQNRQRQYYV